MRSRNQQLASSQHKISIDTDEFTVEYHLRKLSFFTFSLIILLYFSFGIIIITETQFGDQQIYSESSLWKWSVEGVTGNSELTSY